MPRRCPSAPLAAVALAGALAATSGLGTLVAIATPHERSFASARAGVRAEAPAGWEVATASGFPSTLVVFVHPSGARISVSAASAQARSGAEAAAQSQRLLARQALGLSASRAPAVVEGWVEILAEPNRGGEVMRQAYWVRPIGQDAYQTVVVTLVCRSADRAAHARAFEKTLRKLDFFTPEGRAADAGAERG